MGFGICTIQLFVILFLYRGVPRSHWGRRLGPTRLLPQWDVLTTHEFALVMTINIPHKREQLLTIVLIILFTCLEISSTLMCALIMAVTQSSSEEACAPGLLPAVKVVSAAWLPYIMMITKM